MSAAEEFTQKIMNDFLNDLDARFNYITEYKENVGIDIPYSRTSAKYQKKLKRFYH